jgi:hypothetical protein
MTASVRMNRWQSTTRNAVSSHVHVRAITRRVMPAGAQSSHGVCIDAAAPASNTPG